MTDTEKSLKDQDTKQRLVKAAATLFSQKGFHGVSVKEIAELAEANVALVSYHFGGKQGLYEACFDQFVEEFIAFIDQKILRPTSYEDFRFRFRLFIEKLVDDNLNNPEACSIVRNEIDAGTTEASELARKTMTRFFEVIGGFLKSAQKQGYLRTDIATDDVCAIFFGGIQHTLRIDKLRSKVHGESLADPKVRERFVNSALDLFFNGLDAKKKS
jgi:AcrR family transcriptional regulator